jgi:hypothetical protein
LTKYGFPDGDIFRVMDMNHPNIVIEDGEEMQNITRSTLETFSKYTGVTDKYMLRIRRSVSLDSGQFWRIQTENQIYEGLEVKNTPMSIWLDINSIYRIEGNWYSYIYIPKRTISKNQAKESIIGMTLTEYTHTGPMITVVTQELLKRPARKIVVPIINDSNIALHVAWEITVGENDIARFYVYVDVVTSEIIETESPWIF